MEPFDLGYQRLMKDNSDNKSQNTPMIELRDVYKSFGDEEVIKGFNLKVYKGETVVLFGPGGCGKSTVLQLCVGLLKPDKGAVLIKGANITEISEKKLMAIRRNIGMTFQYYALFDSMTVEENIGFFLKNHTKLPYEKVKEQVNEELSKVDLNGTNSLKPVELSGGMQRRVGIARALIHDPEIVLYDSPTDGLDPVSADMINQMILRMNSERQVTCLAISNDMPTAYKIGKRIGMLYDGKIIEMGTPEEIQASRNEYVYQFINGLEEGPI